MQSASGLEAPDSEDLDVRLFVKRGPRTVAILLLVIITILSIVIIAIILIVIIAIILIVIAALCQKRCENAKTEHVACESCPGRPWFYKTEFIHHQ